MRFISSPHSSRALAVLLPKFPLRPWLVLNLLLSFVSGHERIETFSIRFLMGNCKPGNVMWPLHVLLSRLPFGVNVWTAGRAFSGKWLTARFVLSLKIVQPTFKGTNQLSISTYDVVLRFLISKQWVIYVFGRKKRSISNYEKQHGSTNKQWTPC